LFVGVVVSLPFSSLVVPNSHPCATPEVNDDVLNQVQQVLENFSSRVCAIPSLRSTVPMCSPFSSSPSFISTIPTVVHVLHATDGRGNVSDDRVFEQMAILNNDFAGRPADGDFMNTNFRFALQQINRVENDLWFSSMIVMEQIFKPEISVSPIDTLNIYFGEMNGGVAGMCYFPYMHPPMDPMHGCLVHHESVIGGNQHPYASGQTTVHEVGHGLGCQHVWQGGCRVNGDHVNDTSPQETNSRGCPDPIPESCEVGKPDNIHNHMDYSDDDCRWYFTPGQSARFDHVVSTFHPGYLHPAIRQAIETALPGAWAEAEQFASYYKQKYFTK